MLNEALPLNDALRIRAERVYGGWRAEGPDGTVWAYNHLDLLVAAIRRTHPEAIVHAVAEAR